MAGDEKMIEAFRSGRDFHTVTAAQVFGVEPEQVTHEMRRSAKAVNFGIVYGISAFSLSQDIGVTVAEAKAYMDRYFATYPGVRAYMDHVVERAKADGYVSTLMGRRRWLPELKSSNFNTRSFGERVALNMPIQGTAADIIKLAMLRAPGTAGPPGPRRAHRGVPPGGAGAGVRPPPGGDGGGIPPVRPPGGGDPRGTELGGVSLSYFAGGFRRLRAATYFARGGKVGKTPPGTHPMGYGSASLRLGP